MTATILYFGPARGAGPPCGLTLPDAVASAFVRSGTAAAENPAQEGALSAGGSLDAGTPTAIVLVNGVPGLLHLTQLTVPLAVAQAAAAAGIAAAFGGPISPAIPATAVFDGSDQTFDGTDAVLDGV